MIDLICQAFVKWPAPAGKGDMTSFIVIKNFSSPLERSLYLMRHGKMPGIVTHL